MRYGTIRGKATCTLDDLLPVLHQACSTKLSAPFPTEVAVGEWFAGSRSVMLGWWCCE